MIEIKTTCKNRKEAENISKILLKEKLAACVNYYPSESLFFWKGKIEKGKEFQIIVKTNERQKTKVIETIKKLNSYELPVITWNEVNSTKDANDWVNDSV